MPTFFKNNIITLLGLLIAITTNAQSITGVLQNEKGSPIDGATVSILNTSFQTISNQKGYFSFNELKNGKYTLSIKSLGYADVSKEININATSNSKNTNIKITLIASTNQLDEVVITAEKKRRTDSKNFSKYFFIKCKTSNCF